MLEGLRSILEDLLKSSGISNSKNFLSTNNKLLKCCIGVKNTHICMYIHIQHGHSFVNYFQHIL